MTKGHPFKMPNCNCRSPGNTRQHMEAQNFDFPEADAFFATKNLSLCKICAFQMEFWGSLGKRPTLYRTAKIFQSEGGERERERE